jgi:hypothetical protein
MQKNSHNLTTQKEDVTVEIKSYSVGTNRQPSSSDYHRRFLKLEPKNPTNEVEHIVIYFFIKDTNGHLFIGYQTPKTSKLVVGYAHISDFEDMYNIIQSEKPVFFNWGADANNNYLTFFSIGTTAEPPGEGPKD